MAHRRKVRFGKIRINGDSHAAVGLQRGDLVLVDLTRQPANGDRCAAFTAYGKLVVR
jgi:SOS-response transcriptional repressor LexA